MRRRIGFDVPDFEDDSEKEKINKDVEALKTFILSVYKPDGTTEQKDFKTALEIAYELKDMIPATIRNVNRALSELGFEIKYIENIPMWVMFKIVQEY